MIKYRVFESLFFSLIASLLVSSSAMAGSNIGLSVKGKIVSPGGSPVTSASLPVTLKVYDATLNCVLWSETQTLNMSSSNGAFSLVLGQGTRTDGGPHTFKQVFTNAGTLSGLSCGSGGTYTPTASDDRSLVLSFVDNGVSNVLAPISIKAVASALQADQVSGYGIMNLAKISGGGSATTLTPFQFDFLAGLAAPATASSAPCVTNDILKFNGTAWACAADATGGGAITAVTATAPVVSSGGTAPVISMAAATAAVDGYLKATDFTTFNSKLGTASTFAGDVSGTSSTMSVDKLKGAALSITALASGNFLKYSGTAWINSNLAASDIPNLDASKIVSGVLPVANGGTGASTIGAGNLVLGSGTAALSSLASGATGNVVYGSGASNWLSGTPDTAGLVDKTSVQAISGAKTFGATVKMSNQNLFSLGDTGANAVSLKAPATVTSSYTLTMPAALPISNKVLQSDSAGALSWVAAGTGDALTTNPLSQFAATTSAQLSGVLSDETGSGFSVFNTSPVFATDITTPMIVGGSSTTSSLVYKTTTGLGAAGADHIFKVGNNGATEAMRILNSGFVGIGTATPNVNLVVSSNATNPQSAGSSFPGTVLHVAGADGSKSRILIDNYDTAGGTYPVLSLRAARGTAAAPSAVISGDILGQMGAGAFGSSAYSGSTGSINFTATEAWSNTAQGTKIDFKVTPNGSTSSVSATALTIDQSGNVGIGVTTPTAKLEIASGVANTSGLRFTNFNSATPTSTGQALGVDSVGNLVTISSSGGGGGSINTITGALPISVSNGSNPTVSISVANATTDGYLSSADWNTFNNKLSSSSSLAGDVSGTLSTVVVNKVNGQQFSLITPSIGQILRYNGSTWSNGVIAAADIPTLDASKISSGVLPASLGGTGSGGLGIGNLVLGGGTGPMTSLSPLLAGNVLYASGATSWASGSPDAAGLVDKNTVQSIAGAKTFGAPLKISGQNPLILGDLSANSVALRAPSSLTTSYVLNLPMAQGSSGTVLTNDGSGNLSWNAVSGGGGFVAPSGGTVSAPGYYFSSATATGMSAPSPNQLSFSTGGTERMRIDPTGNVSIGGAIASTGTKLQVQGQVAASSASVTIGNIDFSQGNTISTSFDCGSGSLTFSNMRDGGSYTLIVTSPSTAQCNFIATTSGDDASSVSYRFLPTNNVRIASSHTVYSIQRAGTNVYVSWLTGF